MTYTLPEVLDAAAAETLRNAILADQAELLSFDAAVLRHVGFAGLQLLMAVARSDRTVCFNELSPDLQPLFAAASLPFEPAA